MEQQVLELLRATTVPDTDTIKRAEQSLLDSYRLPEFPFALLHIATHTDVDAASRKAALTALRKYVDATWSPDFEEASSQPVNLPEHARKQIQGQILAICTRSDSSDDTGQNLAANVVSKIASADFPDDWPELFPHLVSVLTANTSDSAILGSLRVLYELVDSGLSDEQFFGVASDLVNALKQVAINGSNNPVNQAMALKVLGGCFDNLEQVLQSQYAGAVKAFLDQAMPPWMSFFMTALRLPLPEVSLADFVNPTGVISKWKGVIAVKIQVIQMLVKVKRVYTPSLTPHVFEIFQIIWQDLTNLSHVYTQLFVDRDGEGKLVDSDGLAYTLDALIIEAVDFMSSMLKAKAVRSELTKQTQQSGTEQHATPWLQQLLQVMMLYSRIPGEEEEMWQLDANIYLSETTSQTANYTPRTACSELVTQTLMEWLNRSVTHGLIYFSANSLASPDTAWKEREALLYLMNQVFKESQQVDGPLDAETITHALQQISPYVNDKNSFVKGSAHLALSSLLCVAPEGEYVDISRQSLSLALKAFTEDESSVVNACGLIAVTTYLEVLPRSICLPEQTNIISAIGEYLNQHDLQDELEDSDDIKSALVQILRDVMLLDTSNIEQSPALDYFFNLASDGAGNFMISDLLVETFELVVQSVADCGRNAYIKLCEKTIPSLTGAFHVGAMNPESQLSELGAELTSKLAEFGSDPLPAGFISALMPPLQVILMEATEGDVVRPATTAVSHMLNKGASQFLAWNHDGKSSVEISLTIVDRLISAPEIDETAAEEVGHLATSLVEKCGSEVLGSYLADLIRALAIRLGTAERIQFIQSLCMVFASLSIKAASDVANFLADISINGVSALHVVLTKWLENSVHFAGFEDIRQNAMALSKIYALHDSRVSAISVKGDLVVVDDGRIKTRSRARQNPDTYTQISAPLKMLKILVDELKNAAFSGFTYTGAARAAAEALEEDEDGDSLASNDGDGNDEWEDLGTTGDGSLDLGSTKVRDMLMGLTNDSDATGTGERTGDDQTTDYLIYWFKEQGSKGSFRELFAQLKPEEQQELQRLVA